MKKLLRMWSVTSTNVTLAVSERLQAQKSLAVKVVQNSIQTTETLNSDYTKSSPVAFVPLMSFSGDHGDRVITYNRKLQLAVSLTMPESEYNHKLANGIVTASSSYPCMLQFKRGPIRVIETFLRSAPLIAGLQSETQFLDIKMRDHIEGLEPTACLKVILEQRAEFQSVAGIPQIYAGSLVLQSENPQLRRFVWYWRRTIFVDKHYAILDRVGVYPSLL
ncbi:PREDICTED: seipin-2 [Prunus dulcis]|uniref:PREDICTED: seipin-2 n=1 Tax=Prunus dulcis TaxID=3755 RepID=A0A5E4ETD7_PRUDU|nr:PREDICTED: seipin-2 [Prunus dulcis]